MPGGTMKTSYYLVAAAGLTAAAVTAYDHLPLRAATPAASLPLPRDAVALAPMPAVPDVPLPPIVPPPDGPLVIPVAATPAPLPALPTTPPAPALPPGTVPAVRSAPPLVAPAIPVIPPTPSTPVTTPRVPSIGTPTAPPAAKVADSVLPAIPPIASVPPAAPPPVPVLPSAPPEPKPLPTLPSPTPIKPGLDMLKPEPAANLAPAGKFIVLRGNKLIEGAVIANGDKIIVRRGTLDRSFAKADVLYVAESRDEVHRFMLATVPANNPDARLMVAKWCTLNGLREQALVEARAILKLAPGHRGAADLARSMEESLRQFPGNGSQPKTQGALVTVHEPEPDITPEAASTFVSRAQPILANQCMECHARDNHTSAFKLKRVTGFEVGPQTTHANLRAVASQLKKDDPANSPLLVKALAAHGDMKQPAFVSRQAVAYRMLEAWVAVAVGNASIPTMTPPTPPVFTPAPPVTPIPPATTAAEPPMSPTSPITVPHVLPTPPDIPAAETNTRSTPSKLPAIPVAPATVKPASQFGTGSKPPVPPCVDEFDPAAFNGSPPRPK
jgi:hypothetical protein